MQAPMGNQPTVVDLVSFTKVPAEYFGFSSLQL